MVPGRPVGRPRVGLKRKEQSATALRAYVAGQLHGRADQAFFTRELEVALSTTAVRRAATARQWHPPTYQRPGRESTAATPPWPDAAVRGWVAIQPANMRLGAALITTPVVNARSQASIYRGVQRLNGVVHAWACGDGDRRKVVAVALIDGEHDRRRLRAQLDDVAAGWQWDDVDHETIEPALRTWRHLTRVAAQAEGLELRGGAGYRRQA
jgi:hypothetical protein